MGGLQTPSLLLIGRTQCTEAIKSDFTHFVLIVFCQLHYRQWDSYPCSSCLKFHCAFILPVPNSKFWQALACQFHFKSCWGIPKGNIYKSNAHQRLRECRNWPQYRKFKDTKFKHFLEAFAKLQKATTIFVTSVCPSSWNNSAPTGRILMKIDIWAFSRKPVEKIKVSSKSDNNNRYSTWRRFHVFDNISLNSS